MPYYIATQHSINNGGNVIGPYKFKDKVIVPELVAFWKTLPKT